MALVLSLAYHSVHRDLCNHPNDWLPTACNKEVILRAQAFSRGGDDLGEFKRHLRFMAKDRYAPKQLDEVLGQLSPRMGSRIASYSAKSQQLSQQQTVLREVIGENLAKKCRVANIRDDALIIEAQSATIALKLNYVKMDILSAFRQQGLAQLCQVKIQTSPDAARRLTPQSQTGSNKTTAPKKRAMSEQSAEYLEHVAENAPPSLQEKLRRLALHGRQKK
ncbi:DUF721 domain-containing protein [Pseudoalteromonas ruthenica]